MTIISKTLLKEDRNQTKYYEIVESCPACGGIGYIPEYKHIDGGRCFTCDGSKIKIYKSKEYTSEHEAKLEQNRIKREEIKQLETLANVEKYLSGETKIDFGKYQGKSLLEITEENYSYIQWLSSNSRDFALSLAASKIIEEKSKIKEEEKLAEAKKLEYVGNIGDKIQIQVTLENIFFYNSMYGMVTIYKFLDENENILIWKTTSNLEKIIIVNGEKEFENIQRGETIKIKAIIKEHSEYNGSKQTSINRVKVL